MADAAPTRYAVLTCAPYGGAARGALPSFESLDEAALWGRGRFKDADPSLWFVAPVKVFPEGQTFVVLTRERFGGASYYIPTFPSAAPALRYGSQCCPLESPRAVRVAAGPPGPPLPLCRPPCGSPRRSPASPRSIIRRAAVRRARLLIREDPAP